MPHTAEDRLMLRVTPLVFAAVFALGVWSEPIDLFGVGPTWGTRASFAAAMVTMIISAVWPSERTRFAALAVGSWACLVRGLTLIIEGQDLVPRKSELIGGGVWMACSYFVLASWLLGVPAARWFHDRK